MKAIKTKYLGPTNTLPSRIKASAEGVPSIIYGKDSLENELENRGVSSLNQDNVHKLAARKLAYQYGWGNELASGIISCDVWVHCFITQSNHSAILETPLRSSLTFNFECPKRLDDCPPSALRDIWNQPVQT